MKIEVTDVGVLENGTLVVRFAVTDSRGQRVVLQEHSTEEEVAFVKGVGVTERLWATGCIRFSEMLNQMANEILQKSAERSIRGS